MDHNRRRQKRGALERMAVRLLEDEGTGPIGGDPVSDEPLTLGQPLPPWKQAERTDTARYQSPPRKDGPAQITESGIQGENGGGVLVHGV